MEKITLGGVDFNVTPELLAAIQAAIAAGPGGAPPAAPAPGADDTQPPPTPPKADDKNAPPPAAAPGADDPQKKMDTLQARCDAQLAEIAKLKTVKADAADPATVRAAAKELVRIRTVAERVLATADVERLDSMTDAEIKAAVIKAEQPTADLAGKSPAYVDARFDAIAEGLADAGEPTKDLGTELHGARADGASDEDPVAAAKARQTARTKNAYKGDAKK